MRTNILWCEATDQAVITHLERVKPSMRAAEVRHLVRTALLVIEGGVRLRMQEAKPKEPEGGPQDTAIPLEILQGLPT